MYLCSLCRISVVLRQLREPRIVKTYSLIIFLQRAKMKQSGGFRISCLVILLFIIYCAHCSTFSNIQLDQWYFGNANSTFGTVSYKVTLPQQFKNAQSLFRVYNQVNITKQNHPPQCLLMTD
jgi:hypothetical protein